MSELLTELALAPPEFPDATAEGLDRLWAAILCEADGRKGLDARDIDRALARRARPGR